MSVQIDAAARLAHEVIYVAGIPVVRALAFLAGACATLAIAIALLDRATSRLARDSVSGRIVYG